MSAKKDKKGRKKSTPKAKSPLKKRLDNLEKIIADGIDELVLDNRNLHHNDTIIAGAMEEHDETIAAIRSLLVDKGLLTDEAIDSRRAEVRKIREDVRAEAIRKEEALAAKKAEDLKAAEDAADAARPDAELVLMKGKAEQAGKESGFPEGSFVFGG